MNRGFLQSPSKTRSGKIIARPPLPPPKDDLNFPSLSGTREKKSTTSDKSATPPLNHSQPLPSDVADVASKSGVFDAFDSEPNGAAAVQSGIVESSVFADYGAALNQGVVAVPVAPSGPSQQSPTWSSLFKRTPNNVGRYGYDHGGRDHTMMIDLMVSTWIINHVFLSKKSAHAIMECGDHTMMIDLMVST